MSGGALSRQVVPALEFDLVGSGVVADSQAAAEWAELNRKFAAEWPNITKKLPPRDDSEEWKGKPDKAKLLSSEPGEV